MSKYGKYLYNSLPSIYRLRDIEVDYTLKHYLDALGTGFDIIEEETGKITTLNDVETVDAKFLPVYASMFGLEYDHNVSEDYQRKLLANLIEINKRKGTKSVIEFIARELTGMKAIVREGNRTIFKTWSPEVAITDTLSSRETPTTYDGETPYHYPGGFYTDRFTIIISLVNQDKDKEELFLNTQLLAKLTSELVPPYISILYKASGLYDKDSFNPKVAYSHVDRFYTQDCYNTYVMEYDGIFNTRDTISQYTVESEIMGRFLDVAKVKDNLKDIVNTSVITTESILGIKETTRDFADFGYIEVDTIQIIQKLQEELHETYTWEELTKDLVKLNNDDNISTEVLYDLIKDFISNKEAYINKGEIIQDLLDYLHTKHPTNDIIELGNISEDFSDTIRDLSEDEESDITE